MSFLFAERRAFVRASTHTVVFESDVDFERLRRDPLGQVEIYVDVWIAEQRGPRVRERAYLGCVRLRDGRLGAASLRRVTERLSGVSAGGETARSSRRLGRLLARFAREHLRAVPGSPAP